MAYGDQLRIRVRSTGDFRFEFKPEDEVEETGILVNGGIELNMDELHESLELDTRGTPVREFKGTQRYVDAGADYATLEYLVNVGSGVLVLGLTHTIGYVSDKLRARRESRGQALAEALTDADYERTAIEAASTKFRVDRDEIKIETVEHGIDGRGAVELQVAEDGRRFRIELEMRDSDLRVYRTKRINPPNRF